MGGGAGGAIKAAAKIAGVSVANTSLRGGFSVVPPAEHSVMRSASRPASATICSAGGLSAEAQPKNSWVIVDDWAVDSYEEPPLVSSAFGSDEQMPRLVFGGPPTLEEAKSATDDLKDALDKAFGSSRNLISNCNSPRAGKVSTACLLSNSSDYSAMPKAAMQAFALLCNSPAAQSVVVSIANDGKVWDAVLDNPALKDFLESNKPRHKNEDEQSNNGFSEFLDKVKMSVTGVVNDVSGFIQRIFYSTAAENGTKDSQQESDSSSFTDKMVVASFFALATMVIMVVVMKRA